MATILQMTLSIDILVRKLLYFYSNFTEIFPTSPIDIPADNGRGQSGNKPLLSESIKV